jgi:hypothetical protein
MGFGSFLVGFQHYIKKEGFKSLNTLFFRRPVLHAGAGLARMAG